MTYDVIERSADQARPVELYTFQRDYQAWRYTSADRDVEFDGATYTARPISRTEISDSAELQRSGLKVTVPRDFEVADLYRISPPTLPVTLILRQYHYGDDDAATLWTGRVSTVDFVGLGAEIQCEPVFAGLKRVGLRRLYTRQCAHVLYGPACRLNREAFRVDGTCGGVSGVTISVPAAATEDDGFFSGGYVEYEVELGIAERRSIGNHMGASLTLNAAPLGLAVGASVKLYPGCDHTTVTCNGKFGNILNYGGFPFFTAKNPFGSNPIF